MKIAPKNIPREIPPGLPRVHTVRRAAVRLRVGQQMPHRSVEPVQRGWEANGWRIPNGGQSSGGRACEECFHSAGVREAAENARRRLGEMNRELLAGRKR